jgi:hypothetical protein
LCEDGSILHSSTRCLKQPYATAKKIKHAILSNAYVDIDEPSLKPEHHVLVVYGNIADALGVDSRFSVLILHATSLLNKKLKSTNDKHCQLQPSSLALHIKPFTGSRVQFSYLPRNKRVAVKSTTARTETQPLSTSPHPVD